ncbi:MAG TPA: FAD:protein FMN transferase, partial [Rheinheimera sp.]|nr:FAD:protein FMN transferase [Rheinheimera sp.]
MTDFRVGKSHHCVIGQFRAMASPCEVLLEPQDIALCQHLTQLAAVEAERIEQKYSRYRADSVLSQLNANAGDWQTLDNETRQLLAFADSCYQLSDGLFDISSGILRRIWQFDGSANIACQQQIDALLPYIGWHQVKLEAERLFLPAGMELDLGGIAKEYAVDKVMQLLAAQFAAASMPSIV